jgi:hypothetical protein
MNRTKKRPFVQKTVSEEPLTSKWVGGIGGIPPHLGALKLLYANTPANASIRFNLINILLRKTFSLLAWFIFSKVNYTLMMYFTTNKKGEKLSPC